METTLVTLSDDGDRILWSKRLRYQSTARKEVEDLVRDTFHGDYPWIIGDAGIMYLIL
jgi:hypothetical protein